MRRVNFANLAVVGWALGFFVTAVSIQAPGLGQRGFAEMTAWRFEPGWQSEIAAFDLALAMLMVVALRQRSSRKVLPILLVLGLLLGGNHLVAALGSGRIGNWIGAGANAVGLLLVVAGMTVGDRATRSR